MLAVVINECGSEDMFSRAGAAGARNKSKPKQLPLNFTALNFNGAGV